EIRDVRYQGNQYWEYCIEANDRPLVECVFPLAVVAGSSQTVQPLGELVPSGALAEWKVPANLPPGLHWFELPLGDSRTNPAPVMIADVPLLPESAAENDTVRGAQDITVSCGVNGRIDHEGDIDCFAFE